MKIPCILIFVAPTWIMRHSCNSFSIVVIVIVVFIIVRIIKYYLVTITNWIRFIIININYTLSQHFMDKIIHCKTMKFEIIQRRKFTLSSIIMFTFTFIFDMKICLVTFYQEWLKSGMKWAKHGTIYSGYCRPKSTTGIDATKSRKSSMSPEI